MIEPSNAERSTWPDATQDYVASLEAELQRVKEERDQFDALCGTWMKRADEAFSKAEQAESALREAVGAVAEPTDEMIEAGEEEITSRRQMGMRVYAADIWRAMSKHVLSRLTEHTPQTEEGTP